MPSGGVFFGNFGNKIDRLERTSPVAESLTSKQKMMMLVMSGAIQNTILMDFNYEFGQVEYSLIEGKSQIRFNSSQPWDCLELFLNAQSI